MTNMPIQKKKVSRHFFLATEKWANRRSHTETWQANRREGDVICIHSHLKFRPQCRCFSAVALRVNSRKKVGLLSWGWTCWIKMSSISPSSVTLQKCVPTELLYLTCVSSLKTDFTLRSYLTKRQGRTTSLHAERSWPSHDPDYYCQTMYWTVYL